MGLINITKFPRNCYCGCGSNYTYCDLVGPLIESAFRSCFLESGPNRLYLENSLGVEGGGWGQPLSTSLNHCGYIISCIDILLHYLTSERFAGVSPFFTNHIFQNLMLHQGWSMFLFCHPTLYFWKGGVWKITCETDLLSWY